MPAWRNLGAVLLLLAVVPAGWAETYTLAEPVKVGDCFRIHMEMTLTGGMQVSRDDKVVTIKMAATALHEFPERIMAVGENGLPSKTARVYETARAAISVGQEKSERALRSERTLFVAQRYRDQPLAYCPAGSLTREEMELTSEHFDTLFLTGLLPGKAVAQGETWKLQNGAAQALCGFEGLAEQDLTCKLEEVKDNVARISVKGTATGIDVGAQVKLEIEAACRFDLTARHLVGVEWKQKDKRDQGPANPASTTETTTTIQRTAIEEPPALNQVKLVSIPDGFEPPQAMVNLYYHDAKGRFDLMHARDWRVVSQSDAHLVLRLMDRGDFVAQVTITPWTPAGKDKHLSPDQFKEAMENTPGWEPEKELQSGEVPSEGADGRWMYRISALGKMDGTAVMQNFYLLANANGDQLVAVFTMTPKQAEKLGSRDLSLAGSLELPARK